MTPKHHAARRAETEVAMTTVNALLQELDQEAQATFRVLARVPEDRLEWRPHEKSMTLGQLAMHIATLPGAIAELSTLSTFDVNTEVPRPGARSVAEVTSTLEKSLAKAKTLLEAISDADLAAPWQGVSRDQVVMEVSRGALLRSVMLNHLYHHRGQLSVYLRLTGASVPAIYGASADEAPVFG